MSDNHGWMGKAISDEALVVLGADETCASEFTDEDGDDHYCTLDDPHENCDCECHCGVTW